MKKLPFHVNSTVVHKANYFVDSAAPLSWRDGKYSGRGQQQPAAANNVSMTQSAEWSLVPGHCCNTTTTIGKNVQIFHFKETVNDCWADKIRATVIVTCKYHGISLK